MPPPKTTIFKALPFFPVLHTLIAYHPGAACTSLFSADSPKGKEMKKNLDILSICDIIPLADAGIAHPVERHLAKVEVASSSLVARSIQNLLRLQWVFFIRGYGGIGRHAGFRFQWATVQVQVLLPAPEKGHPKGCPFSGAGNRVTGFCPRAARRQRRKPLMRLPSPFREFKSCFPVRPAAFLASGFCCR